jgi:hypothetical protein
MLPLRIGAILMSVSVVAAPAVAQEGDGMAPGAMLAVAKTSPGSSGTANSAGQANPQFGRYRYRYHGYGYRYRGYGYGYGYGGYGYYSYYRSNNKSDLDNVEPGSIIVRSEASSGSAQGPRLLQPQ